MDVLPYHYELLSIYIIFNLYGDFEFDCKYSECLDQMFISLSINDKVFVILSRETKDKSQLLFFMAFSRSCNETVHDFSLESI